MAKDQFCKLVRGIVNAAQLALSQVDSIGELVVVHPRGTMRMVKRALTALKDCSFAAWGESEQSAREEIILAYSVLGFASAKLGSVLEGFIDDGESTNQLELQTFSNRLKLVLTRCLSAFRDPCGLLDCDTKCGGVPMKDFETWN